MIIIKTEAEIKKISESNKIIRKFFDIIEKIIKPGITTLELNKIAEDIAYSNNAVPGFLNYKGFPYSICASKNDEIIHGFPSSKPLNNGDMLSIDFGIKKDGYYGDAAITVPVGTVSKAAKNIIKITRECLQKGIEQSIPGNRLDNIGHAIQQHAEKNNYGVAKDYVGHGIGKELHEDPQVKNYGTKGQGILLKENMVICIEPMLLENINATTKPQPDGWTVATSDGCLSAHFEHCIIIKNKKAEILSI